MTDRRSPLDFYAPIEAATLPRSKAPAPVEQPSLGELWRASRTQAQADLPQADRDRVYDAWTPIVDRLNQGRSAGQRIGNPAMGSNDRLQTLFGLLPGRDEQEASTWAAVERARASDPAAFADLPKSLDEFHDKITAAAKAKLQAARQVTARNGTWTGSAVDFAGNVVTSFQDPVNLMTLPVGGAGRSVATRFLTEALANAGVEAIEQPLVAEQRRLLGEELTTEEAVKNVAAAGVFGAAFQGAGEGAVALARSGAGQRARAAVGGAVSRGADLARTVRERIGWSRLTDDEKAAVVALERHDEVAATTPFTGGGAVEAHLARVDAAMQALDDPRGYTAATSGTSGRPANDWDVAQGRRTSAPAASGFDMRAYTQRLAVVESGGRWQVGADTSSAYGMYQITRGTWLRYAEQARIKGPTDDITWGKRTNPAAQEAVFNAITRDNRAALTRIGAPETAGNLYLMHFAGAGGGSKILRAAGETPIERLLTKRAIEANSFLKGKTAEDVIAWAHAKMGGEAPNGPILSRAGFDEDEAGDVAWRAAQDEVDAAERSLADARRESMPDADDDIPFDLDDPRALTGDQPPRDPFADLDVGPEVPPGRMVEPADEIADAVASWPRTVATLRDAQDGEVRGALYHPDIGPIDVKWGAVGTGKSDGYGLAKIVRFHPEVLDDLPRLLADMTVVAPTKNRIKLESATHDASVRLDWDGQEQKWLMTAYERETPAASVYAREAAGGRTSSDLGAPQDIEAARPGDNDATERGRVDPGDRAEPEVPVEPFRAEDATSDGFDHPDDVAANRQMDSLEHDLRMWLSEDGAAGATVRLNEEGDVVSAADALEELDADEAAIDAAWACMKPGDEA